MLLAPLSAWTGLMVSLYLAFNPWTLRSMEKPGPAQRLRQATLARGGFYQFHQFTVTSLQKLISRFILMDEAIVSSHQSGAPTNKRLLKKFGSKNHATKSSRLLTYLNVDAFETTFLLAQGYTTLSLFMSFILSGNIVLFGMTPLGMILRSNEQVAGTALSSILWLLTSFMSITVVAPILRDGLKYRNRENADATISLSGMGFEIYLLTLFSILFPLTLALNRENALWMVYISTAAIILYGCSRSVLFVATVTSCICQMIVIGISGWSIPSFLALSILWVALYKFARAHGMGPLLPSVQTRRFSWGYFISTHMAAPPNIIHVGHFPHCWTLLSSIARVRAATPY
jgi:hypothetical protein